MRYVVRPSIPDLGKNEKSRVPSRGGLRLRLCIPLEARIVTFRRCISEHRDRLFCLFCFFHAFLVLTSFRVTFCFSPTFLAYYM